MSRLQRCIDLIARGLARLDEGRSDEARDLARQALIVGMACEHHETLFGRKAALYWTTRLLDAVGDRDAADRSWTLLAESQLGAAPEDVHDRCRVEHEVAHTFEAWLRVNHPALCDARLRLATTLNNMALSYYHVDLPRARGLLEQAVKEFEQAVALDDLRLQDARGNLAAVLGLMGDRRGALALEEQVLAVLKRQVVIGALARDNDGLLKALGNHSTTLRALGHLSRARELQEEVLTAAERTWPGDCREMQIARINLAVTLDWLGEHALARGFAEEALSNLGSRPSGQRDLLLVRSVLAASLWNLGDYRRAREMQGYVLEQSERLLLPWHPSLGNAHLNMAIMQASDGSWREAWQSALAVGRCLRARLAAVSSTASCLALAQLGDEVDDAVSLMLSMSDNSVASAYAECDVLGLQRVVVALFRVRGHQLRRAADDPRVSEALSHARKASWSLHRLLEREPAPEELQAARSDWTQADQALSRLAAGLGMEGLPQVWPDDAVGILRKTLPTSTVLVITAHYERLDVTEKRRVAQAAAHVAHCGGIRRIELGAAKPIAEAAEDLRLRLENRGSEGRSNDRPPDSAASARALGELLSPLMAALPAGTEQIWLCPDGALASVPWEQIEDEAGELGDRFRFTYLTDLGQAIPREAQPLSAPSLLCFGGIDFGAASGPEQDAEDRSPHRGMARSGNQRWPPLEASGREAEAVCEQFEKQHGKRAVLHRTGSAATRACFVNACNGQRFVHLATHAGYGLAEDWAMGESKADELLLRSDRGVGVDRDLLSWIVFAGANSEDRGVRAGSLLTASEITSLDLTGCELVVASACDTNVGGRYFGEGVVGLNRSLHFAGARYTISSLWKVDDRGAKAFFEAFYRRLWDGTDCGVEAAFRHARETLRKRREWSSVWAAFVLYGPPMR